nr:hypothetical protein HUO10_005797 [Paraburkholderia busanensis]
MLNDDSVFTASRLVDLISRIASGDRHAIHSLYGLVAPLMYRSTLSIIHNVTEAESVICDTFVDIWHDAASYDAEEIAPFAWLVKLQHEQLVRHSCFDGATSSQSDESSPTSLHEHRPVQTRQNLRQLMTAYGGQLSWEEIGEILQMSRTAARSWVISDSQYC